MTKLDKKTLRKFAVVLMLTNKPTLRLMYFSCKDHYFNKILLLNYYVDLPNLLFWHEFDKLSNNDLTIIYAMVCRSCYKKRVNLKEGKEKLCL